MKKVEGTTALEALVYNFGTKVLGVPSDAKKYVIFEKQDHNTRKYISSTDYEEIAIRKIVHNKKLAYINRRDLL